MKKHAASSAGHKQLAGKTTSIQTAGQGGLFEYAWPIVAAGFGTLLLLSFLLPVDSISVFIGSAQPQNLGWLALAATAALLSRNSSIQVRASRFELLIVGGGLIWLLLVTWIASSRGDGRAVWNGFWQVVSLASCFYISRALVQSPKVQRVLVLLIVVGCSSLSFQGLEQVLISMPANRAEYAKDPERMLKEQGIDAPPGSPRRKQFEDRLNSPEPFATFALANSLATLLSLGVILNGGLFLDAVTRRNEAVPKDSIRWLRLSAISDGSDVSDSTCLLAAYAQPDRISVSDHCSSDLDVIGIDAWQSCLVIEGDAVGWGGAGDRFDCEFSLVGFDRSIGFERSAEEF